MWGDIFSMLLVPTPLNRHTTDPPSSTHPPPTTLCPFKHLQPDEVGPSPRWCCAELANPLIENMCPRAYRQQAEVYQECSGGVVCALVDYLVSLCAKNLFFVWLPVVTTVVLATKLSKRRGDMFFVLQGFLLHTALCSLPMLTGPSDEVSPSP